MKRILLFLAPAALFAAQARYARLGEFQGKVEVQLTAADPWTAAERNLPLPESTWLRTGPASRLEIELDEGSALRLGPDSQCALADYTRLSTGQRVTLLWLDRGQAWFTGQPEGRDSLILAAPGAQITPLRGVRVRFEIQDNWTQIAIIEGAVRFSSAAAEIDLAEGQTTRVEPANPARFFLNREITALELDKWSEDRDKALEASPSAAHVVQRYGLQDLDAAGEWIQTEDLGTVWKPRVVKNWTPFQSGHWRWFGQLGYTWVSDEPWGWLPYHFGRWSPRENLGWVWVPAKNTIFKPGDVYWLHGDRVAGWGPLAPGEDWNPPDVPRQYINANITFAAFQADTLLIDPAGFTARPKDPLHTTTLNLALPSPAFLPSRLEATRPILNAGKAHVNPMVDGAIVETASVPTPVVVQPPPPPPVVVTDPAPPPPPPMSGPPVVYPVPVYTPVIIQVPDHPDYARRLPGVYRPGSSTKPPTTSSQSGQSGSPSTGQTPSPTRPSVPAPPTTPNPSTPKPHPGTGGTTTPGSPLPIKIPIGDREKKLFGDATLGLEKSEYARTLNSLDTWSHDFPTSALNDVRLYYYMQVYNGLRQPAKVVDTAARLFDPRRQHSLDPQQTLAALYLASINAASLPAPNRDQVATGRRAAQSILQSAPAYFTASNRPAPVSETDWNKARDELMATANSILTAMNGR